MVVEANVNAEASPPPQGMHERASTRIYGLLWAILTGGRKNGRRTARTPVLRAQAKVARVLLGLIERSCGPKARRPEARAYSSEGERWIKALGVSVAINFDFVLW